MTAQMERNGKHVIFQAGVHVGLLEYGFLSRSKGIVVFFRIGVLQLYSKYTNNICEGVLCNYCSFTAIDHYKESTKNILQTMQPLNIAICLFIYKLCYEIQLLLSIAIYETKYIETSLQRTPSGPRKLSLWCYGMAKTTSNSAKRIFGRKSIKTIYNTI